MTLEKNSLINGALCKLTLKSCHDDDEVDVMKWTISAIFHIFLSTLMSENLSKALPGYPSFGDIGRPLACV